MPNTTIPGKTRPVKEIWLDRAARWLDTHERWALAALIGFYLLITGAQATLKLVWADELITFYIAKQLGLAGIWHALRLGADPNPPLMHVLVKASTAILGGNALGMRLPAIACVLLALLSMWWMLRRWVGPVFALAGVLSFMATRGFDYAYDARSYAPMMGFAMASLALWMASRNLAGWRQFAALAGMTVALAAGISSNYYCVLAFFPIALGEAIDTWKTRRVRLGCWFGMAVASLPLLAYLPLIRHNIAEFGPHAWNRPQVSMVGLSYLELVEGVFWPVIGLGIYAFWKHRGSFHIPSPEAAAVGVLLVYPLLGLAIALAGAGMISPRCVAPVCCGFGLAAGVLGQRVFGASRRGGIAMVLVLLAWVTVREGVCAGILLQQRRAFFALEHKIEASGATRILVADSSFRLPLHFYLNRQVARLITFPIDFPAIHRFERDDSGEQNLWAGRDGIFPMRIQSFDEVDLSEYKRPDSPQFLVITRPDGWLARSVEARGFVLKSNGDDSDWHRLGGVFTPMAHDETRLLQSQP